LKNPFSESTRSLFIFVKNCSRCGSNQSVELDHIEGRISNSPYNASPLCRECHMNKVSKGWRGRKEQRQWTRDFLDKQDYKETKKDIEFYKSI